MKTRIVLALALSVLLVPLVSGGVWSYDNCERYGVVDQWGTDGSGTDPMSVKLTALGAKFIRSGWDWDLIERWGDNQYDQGYLDLMDNWANTMNALGVHILYGFSYTPPWAAANGIGHNAPPMDPTRYTDFITFMVNRYKDRIHHWGFWNEMNLDQFWSGTDSFYINNLLIPGIAAVKAADPTAVTVVGELASCCSEESILQTTLNAITTAGQKDNVDVVCAHAYGYGDTAAGRLAHIDSLRNIIVNAGYGAKDFWCTETSFGGTEQNQSNQLLAFLQGMDARRTWWKKTIYYTFGCAAEDGGLLRCDLSERLAYGTYQSYIAAHAGDQWTYGNNGNPWSLPGTIQAENYDDGCEGVSYHDQDNFNSGGAYRKEGVDIESCSEGGYNTGWMSGGEWLEYTVNVASGGVYDLSLRVASPNSNTTYHVEMNGNNITGTKTIPNTGGWQNWATTTALVTLNAGQQIMRVVVETGGWNLNYITAQSSVNNAQYISNTIPTTMTAGQQYNVSVTMKNNGTRTWSYDAGHKLGAVGDSDPFAGTRQSLNPGETVAPQAQRTFSFVMTAPTTPATYTTDWRMVQEGVEWFGDTLTRTVQVNPADTTAPTFGGSINPSTTNTLTPTITITCQDTGSGLNVGSAEFAYSVDGGNSFCTYVGRYTLHSSGTGSGGGNRYWYPDFYHPVGYTIAAGDHLQYDIYLNNTDGKGAVDLEGSFGNLRDSGKLDQNGLGAHANTNLYSQAYHQWYHRDFDLSSWAGHTISAYEMAHETDSGVSDFYVRNVIITNNGLVKDKAADTTNWVSVGNTVAPISDGYSSTAGPEMLAGDPASPASCTGTNGTTAQQTVSAVFSNRLMPLQYGSNNRIKYHMSDMAGNMRISSVFPLTITQTVTLNNSAFDADANGWTLTPWRASTMYSYGTIAWTSGVGNPGGGLRCSGAGSSDNTDRCTREGGEAQKTISTAGYSNIRVYYDLKVNTLGQNNTGTGAGSCAVDHNLIDEQITVYYSTNGGSSWTEAEYLLRGSLLATYQTYGARMIDLTGVSAVNNNPNFRLRFRWQVNSGADLCDLDNIRVTSN